MEETRVKKYQDYRKTLEKRSNNDDFNNILQNVSKKSDTTTLPMDEVLPEIKRSKSSKFNDWILRNRYILKFILIVVGLCVAIAGIILWIISIWRA